MAVTKAEINISLDNLEFDIGGSFLLNVVDYLIPIFEVFIRKEIKKQVEAKLTT